MARLKRKAMNPPTDIRIEKIDKLWVVLINNKKRFTMAGYLSIAEARQLARTLMKDAKIC